MSDDRFGDPVDLTKLNTDSIIPDALPHPTDPWSVAHTPDAPFNKTEVPSPAPSQQPEDVQRTSSSGSSAQAAPEPPPPGVIPVPPVAPATRKETAALRRFRQVLGLSRISTQEISIVRSDPDDSSKNVTIKFGVRGMNYDDYLWATTNTSMLMADGREIGSAWQLSVLAFGIASIDGVPVWEVFGLQPSDPSHVKDPLYPERGLRFTAASLLCDELQATFWDVEQSLYTQYVEVVDNKYLAKKDTEKDTEKDAQEDDVPLA